MFLASRFFRGGCLAAILFAVSFMAAPQEANALFEEDAYVTSWESYEASYNALVSDGGSAEGSYHYYVAIYSYYGYYYAATGYFYGSDSLIDDARDYHQAAYDLADALLYYGVGGYDTFLAREQASRANVACFWAWLL